VLVKPCTPQLSLAVGAVQVAVWLQAVLPIPVFTDMFDGQPVITGTVLSATVTVKLQVAVLPAASTAV
jgi:predicted secreted protein